MARASPGRAGGAGQGGAASGMGKFEGLAEGLDMPLADALLWNCRGDLLHKTTDGCTSAALKSADGTRWIGHNEDGDPYLYGRCHLVDVALDDAPGYLGFYYPGSLPGHTFGANRAGLVQTINNLRARQRHEGVPRMILARAAGLCHAGRGRAAAARHALRRGFHHTLGSAQDARLFSVEVLPGDVSIQEIGARYGHANHMIHADTAGLPQVVTDSSRARQHRIEGIVDSWSPATGGASCWPRCTIPRAHCRSCARTGMTPMARTRWPPPCLRSATAKSRCACTTASRARRSRWT